MWGPRRAAANTSASRGAYQVVGRWIQQLHVHAALARRELNETASRRESARMLQVHPLRGLRSIDSSVFGVKEPVLIMHCAEVDAVNAKEA